MALALHRIVSTIALGMLLAGCSTPSVFSKTAYLGSIEIDSPDVSALADGLYKGTAKVAVPLGSVAAFPYADVEVTISGGKYSALKLTRPDSLSGDPKFAELAARIIAAQSPDVDGVSGCSFTSKAFELAVVKAVKP